jgi:arginyl-tRNA synthetase
VLLKSDVKGSVPKNYEPNAQESEVVKLLASFPDVLKDSAEKYEPSYIARFAVDLAQRYNKFYFDCKILTAEDEAKKFRLALTEVTLRTLKNALSILGIGVPDKM